MFLGGNDAQKDTKWLKVALCPGFLKSGKSSETGLVHMSPVRLRCFGGEPMEKNLGGGRMG